MKRFYFCFIALIVLSAWFGLNFKSIAQSDEQKAAEIVFVSPNIVISQFYGGGGLANAQFRNDFVELFNRGTSPVSLNGWSVQYASAGGTNWLPTSLPNVTLAPGQYFLIQFAASGSVGENLPTPDLIAPVLQPEGFIPNLSSTSGKLAVVNSTARLPASTCPSDPTIVDLVGYGATASCFEGARTATLSITTAGLRNGGGCADTDNNSLDFTIVAPAPRNTSSPTISCNLGGLLQAGGGANPNMVAPGGTTLLTVSVIPATTPPSTNITVVGNLTDIGGAANQVFFDNGSSGDVTAGDNIFSFLAIIPAGTTGGIHNVTAVASDAQSRTANVSINITVNAPLPGEDPLILGNPS
ncbi:MAG: lamin tail domain-containing protein, partial [Acidobacteriota bacterium]|nr:lamin tail domain-containing protein [Acidobacteriota bacterium]